jgi:hypothetical protein
MPSGDPQKECLTCGTRPAPQPLVSSGAAIRGRPRPGSILLYYVEPPGLKMSAIV